MSKSPSGSPHSTINDTSNRPDGTAEPAAPTRRSRGRPLKNPAAGPASAAMRAAALRRREKREMDSLIYCLTQAMATLEQYGQHHEAGYLFNGMGEHALSAIRRHSPAKAEELHKQSERCRALTNEFSDRIHGPPVPAGRAQSSIVHGGREFALTPAGTVTCDGVVTEFRVVRYPRACVVVQTPYSRLSHRTHRQQDMLKMALYDVALLLAERGDGAGQVMLHPSGGHKSPIPVAKSYRLKPVGESLDQPAD